MIRKIDNGKVVRYEGRHPGYDINKNTDHFIGTLVPLAPETRLEVLARIIKAIDEMGAG